MLKNLELISRKASEVQEEREETIKSSKSKKNKIKEPTPLISARYPGGRRF